MKKGVVYLLLTALLFASIEVSLKLAGSSFGALQMTFLRFFIGGLFLLPFAVIDLKKRGVKLDRGDWLWLGMLGTICVCFSMTLYQLGVMTTSASLAAVIISMSPVFTMTFAHFLVNDRFTKRKALVLTLNLIGLLIVANPFGAGPAGSYSGVGLILGGTVLFGLYTALGKKRIAKIGGIAQSSLSFLLGCLPLLAGLLLFGVPVLDGISLNSLPILLYLGIFATGIGYYCYHKVIELAGPSTASITFFIKLVFAPILAFLVLHEEITLSVIIGILFVVAGSAVNLLGGKKASPEQKKIVS